MYKISLFIVSVPSICVCTQFVGARFLEIWRGFDGSGWYLGPLKTNQTNIGRSPPTETQLYQLKPVQIN